MRPHRPSRGDNNRMQSSLVGPGTSSRNLVRSAVGIVLGQFGVFTALLAPAVVSLAVHVARICPGNRTIVLSTALTIGAIVAMLANPVFGALSDRTRSRFGQRRVWMIAGCVLGFSGLFALSRSTGPLDVYFGWGMTQIGYNAAIAAIAALLNDVVPDQYRGRFASFMGIAQYSAFLSASYIVSLCASSDSAMFLMPGAIGFVGVAALALLVPEVAIAGEGQARASSGRAPRFRLKHINLSRDFSWAFASRLFTTAAPFTFLSYQTFYYVDVYKIPVSQAAKLVFKASVADTVCLLLFSAVCGWLSDRLGLRKVFVWVASALIGAMLLVIPHVSSFTTLLLFVGVMGGAHGVYSSVDHALVIEVLPNKKRAARDIGIMNIAGVLPQSIVPALAPVLIGLGGTHGYLVYFGFGALCAFIGALAILPVRAVR